MLQQMHNNHFSHHVSLQLSQKRRPARAVRSRTQVTQLIDNPAECLPPFQMPPRSPSNLKGRAVWNLQRYPSDPATKEMRVFNGQAVNHLDNGPRIHPQNPPIG